MRGIALLRNARIQNANDVVNLAFGYASEEAEKKVCPWIAFIPIQWWCLATEAKISLSEIELLKKVSGD